MTLSKTQGRTLNFHPAVADEKIAVAEVSVTRKRQVFRLGRNRYFSPASEMDGIGDIEITADDPKSVPFLVDYLIGLGEKAAGDFAKKLASDFVSWATGDDDGKKDSDEGGDDKGMVCTTVTIQTRNGSSTVTTCSPVQ